MFRRIKADILFLSLFIALSAIFYNGFAEFNELPKGIHSWKQSMHFSIIQNYANESTTFWHPAIHNLFNTNNSGNLILEFPIFHKLTADIIKLFPSATPVLFRWIMFFLTIVGYYHAYKLGIIVLKDKLLAIFASLFSFVIPLVVFYGANYLVDVPAMALGFSAIYFFEKDQSKSTFRNIFIGMVFLTLSGLLRVTILVFPISYIIASIIFRKKISYLLWIIPTVLIVFCWYYYVKKYNTYYVSFPPAETYTHLSAEKISNTFDSIFRFMVYQFGFIYRYIIYYIAVLFLLIFYRKKLSRFWYIVLIINILGSLIYVFLWFGIFEHHDYYFIPVIPLSFLIWINIFYAIPKPQFRKHFVIAAIILLSFNSITVYANMRQRTYKKKIKITHIFPSKFESGMWYFFKDDDKAKWKVLRDISPYKNINFLVDYGILPEDTIICDYDISPTLSLALLNKKGWTGYNRKFNSFEDYKFYIDQGAKYLFTNTQRKPFLDSISSQLLTKEFIFQKDSLQVYKINHIKNN